MPPDDENLLRLTTRVDLLEAVICRLLARAGVPADQVAAWRGSANSGSSYYMHGRMNEILKTLDGREPVPDAVHRPPKLSIIRPMCGRARLSTDWQQIRIQMKLAPEAPALNLRPSWNIAPTQDMLIVADRPGVGRVGRLAKWGLIPSWSKEPKAAGATFNARSDSMRDKPTFRNAWAKGRRCLVVVDGYYEWDKVTKEPYAIGRADGKLMALGGLWERWAREGEEEVYSCTIVTIDAGALMRPLHDREPLSIEEKDWPVWLGEEAGDVDALIKPAETGLIHWRVSKEVGNVRNNWPGLADQLQR